MKINGTKVTITHDKVGPFDAYYERGCILPIIPNGKHVRRAFDYDGFHIGIVTRNWHIGQKLLICLIPTLVAALVYGYCYLSDASKVYCIIYRPTEPYRIDSETVGLDITNFSDDTLYIHVDKECYPLDKGDTLSSVPLSSSEFTLILEYRGHTYEEVVKL